jgi:hypothetical protein
MPFCPNCRYEYRPGIEKCSDCGAQLVETLPEEGTPSYKPPPPTGNDVPVARAESLAIAEMWAELLGDEGISCRIVPAGVGDTTLVPGGQTAWEVRTAAIDATRARDILPIERHAAEMPEEDAVTADKQAMTRAVRWLIIAVAVFIAIVVLAFGARYFG